MSEAKYRKNPALLDTYMKGRKKPLKSKYYDLWKSLGYSSDSQIADSIFDDLNPILEKNKPQAPSRETILTLIEEQLGLQSKSQPVDNNLLSLLLKSESLVYEDFSRLLKTPLTSQQRLWLLENPNFPEGYLNMLGVRRDLRPVVARHPRVNLKLLEKMADDSEVEVRIAVAQNPKAPQEIIEKLQNDSNPQVREVALKR